jgi:leader peptidase (prepilin peptidase)/N-methyltransferase
MGGGDVKLAAVIGLALGLMALRRADRNTRIAFGPWMIIGALLGVLAS